MAKLPYKENIVLNDNVYIAYDLLPQGQEVIESILPIPQSLDEDDDR